MAEPSEAKKMMGLSGLEALRGIIAGAFAPPSICATLNFDLVEVSEGFAAFEGTPTDKVLNPLGAVHGGWALTLIDSACGAAGHTMLPGAGYGTLETKANMVRAISPQTGKLRCEGRVLNAGRSIITCEAKLTGPDGKLYAHGTSTCMIVRPEGTKT
jgi:uncharacterized protein (TIGR00369 family)